MTIITANLTFDPLMAEHEAMYVCHVQGDNDANINVRVGVDLGKCQEWLVVLYNCFFISL